MKKFNEDKLNSFTSLNRFIFLTLTLTLTLTFLISLKDVYAAGIISTKHNFSLTGPGPIKSSTEEQVCVFCHTPHHAGTAAPLWNRTMSSAVYQLYSSATLLSPTSPAIQPDKDSKLCLSCHDGTVAIGAVVNVGGAASTISMQQSGAPITTLPSSSSAYLGTDLSGHHPVSIEINALLITDKQTQCNDGTVSFKICPPQTGQPVQLRPTNNSYGGSSAPRWGVQCTSCHDPHRDPNPPRSVFLRVGDANNTDQLCTTCHVDCYSACP